MNLHLLRMFHAIGKHKSFSRAAESVHVTQPAVSRAIRELESQLGISLVERTKGEVSLTEAGDSLYNHARAIFALEQSAISDLNSRKGLTNGSLIIGASMTIATYILPALMSQFVEQYPDINLRIISGNTGKIEKQLLNYELDIAFVEGPVKDARIELRLWREDELVVLAPASHPLTSRSTVEPSELSKERWIIREEGSGTRATSESLMQNIGISPSSVIEVSNIGSVVESVASGIGLAVVSQEAVRDQVRLNRVTPLRLSTRFPRKLHHIRLKDKPLSPPAARFLDLI